MNIAFADKSLRALKSLWIGKITNYSYGSVILLDGVTDAKKLQFLNQEKEGIYLMDKVSEISNIFQEYRQIALRLLLLVSAIIAILLIYRYGFRHASFVFLPPILASSLTLAIMGLINYPVNLFNILALFLVLGVGVDYTIFYAEDRKSAPTTSLAVILSSITTLLSFSLLSFSSFSVIHSIGLTILFGVLFSYLLSPMASLIHDKDFSH